MEEAPTVTLAGKVYPIPLLVPRQQREVVPALLQFTSVLGDMSKMSKDHYNELLKIVYWGAIWPNKKDAHFERDLLDTEVQWSEIVAAVATIRERTGLFRKAEDGEDAPTGEAKAVA